MRFPYIRHRVDPSPAIPQGEVVRPEIPVRIIGPGGFIDVTGLLDTGADHVFLSILLAELLGIEIDQQLAEAAAGAGGHELKVWPGEVEFQLLGDNRSWRWRAHVGFLDSGDEPAAAFLGQAGFLEYFRASFDYDEQVVELIPKGKFGLKS